MFPAYRDIRVLTASQPLWYDHHGVPRYEPFRPDMLGVQDVYASLIEIECASCHVHLLAVQGTLLPADW